MVNSIDIPELSDRSLKLFKALVENFIEDGTPVGSRTLAKEVNINLSPATIRNVMADLEDLGLLHSPHTSAGRVPTVKGYRLFVDSLLQVNKLNSKDTEHIARELTQDKDDDMESLIKKTSAMLSDVTKLAGVVMLSNPKKSILQHIEFISLSASRILVIMIVNGKEVQNRVINVERIYSASELQNISNYLNETYVGKEIVVIRNSFISDLEKMKNDVNYSMQNMIEMAQKIFDQNLNKNEGDNLQLSGQTNLMDVAELSSMERLKKLFETFNKKRDILHLLEQAVHADGMQIFIGEESGYEVLDNCSIVTSPYDVDGRVLGVLGVIGPTRMHYERVIPIVNITAKTLSMALDLRN